MQLHQFSRVGKHGKNFAVTPMLRPGSMLFYSCVPWGKAHLNNTLHYCFLRRYYFTCCPGGAPIRHGCKRLLG